MECPDQKEDVPEFFDDTVIALRYLGRCYGVLSEHQNCASLVRNQSARTTCVPCVSLQKKGVPSMDSPVIAVHIQGTRSLPLTAIDVVEGNPRLSFDEHELANLAASIKEHGGVFQPVIVTPAASKNHFRLVAGERRFRASFLAGKSEILSMIVLGDEEALRSIQLDENLLRVQLNPVEEALAFAKMRNEKRLSLSALARRVKRSPDYVRARLALLQLTEGVQSQVASSRLSLGAAGELSKVAPDESQEDLAQQVVEQQLTVEQTAQLVRDYRASLHKHQRKDALREKRDSWVRYLLAVVPGVITSETFDATKHHRSSWLTFPECGDCPKKGIFVSDECVGEDCCVDPGCYQSLARRESEAAEKRRQERATFRYTAFQRVTDGSEVTHAHLRYVLWVMLRGLHDTDSWRRQVGLSPWHGGEDGTKEWRLIADWPMDRLLGGILDLAADYLAHLSCAFPTAWLPLDLRKSLHEEFAVPAEALDLSDKSAEEHTL